MQQSYILDNSNEFETSKMMNFASQTISFSLLGGIHAYVVWYHIIARYVRPQINPPIHIQNNQMRLRTPPPAYNSDNGTSIELSTLSSDAHPTVNENPV